MALKPAISAVFYNALALLRDLCLSSEQHTDRDRPVLLGSDLIGEYNFRSDGLDAGTDPIGWYEEDL